MLVTTYQTTRRYDPEKKIRCREDLTLLLLLLLLLLTRHINNKELNKIELNLLLLLLFDSLSLPCKI
jgi:hypothetical protein